MVSPKVQQKRRADIRQRVSGTAGGYLQCLVLGCPYPTSAKLGVGLNKRYCPSHEERYRRHGSYSKGSYKAAELNPQRALALRWLRANETLPDVREAVARVLIKCTVGRPEEAFRLAGKNPESRARVIWARLHARQIEPLEILAAWLAVELCEALDHQPERKQHFRCVQAAKVLHRLSGGTHKRWERLDEKGTLTVTELHRYPASKGRVLVHLGSDLCEAAAPVRGYLQSILASS